MKRSIWEAYRIQEWPRMIRVRQKFDDYHIEDIPQAIKNEFLRQESKIDLEGKSIAVAVGSRGIANLDIIVKSVITELKARNAKPFIVPAMGSHGAAFAEGQRDVLVGLGITEESVGAPIVSDMDVDLIGYCGDIPVYTSTTARKADGIIPVARIKTHTSFRGDFESGILKMVVVGLGKHVGACAFHQAGFENMANNLVDMARLLFDNLKIICSVGIVENGYEQTAALEVMTPEEVWTREPELLKYSKSMMPRIPYTDIDLLVMRELGKAVSGDGMDPNITGRYCAHTMKPDYTKMPRIKRITVFDVNAQSHGVASGTGYTDTITRKLFEKIDFDCIYQNALTATETTGARIPMITPDERTAIEAACRNFIIKDIHQLKLCFMTNTLRLDEMYVSEAMCGTEIDSCDVEYVSDFFELEFDEENNVKIEWP